MSKPASARATQVWLSAAWAGAGLLVLAGVVVFIGTRKPPATHIHDIRKTRWFTDNEFFRDLVAAGVVAESDLARVAGAKPAAAGFIGVSGEKIDWEEALALAGSTGSMVVPVDRLVEEDAEAAKGLATMFPDLLGTTVWIAEKGEPRIADLPDYGPAGTLLRRRFALLYWAVPGRKAPPAPTPEPPPPGAPPFEFADIPAGTFRMGDALDGLADAVPREVTVAGFRIGTTEVTFAQWSAVRIWGTDHGYADLTPGGGKAGDHPVHSVAWHDAVKWCNACSEMEGLPPCYTVGGAVLRGGVADGVACDWGSPGYRLPTEAEWEKAARGGLAGKRFPWGDSISHARADCYLGYPWFPYAEGAGRGGYHPAWQAGGMPYTAPVGTFPANRFGLHDTAGNVLEWCWDWYAPDSYAKALPADPRGPAAGAFRVCRGGGWHSNADDCRNAARGKRDPAGISDHLGFRVARSSPP